MVVVARRYGAIPPTTTTRNLRLVERRYGAVPPTRRTATRTPTRPGISTVARPSISTVARPSIIPLVRPTVSMGVSAPSIIPVAGASGAGGLPGGGLTGGLSTSLGSIGTDISTTFGGIVNQAKGFIPTAVKIIAVVVVLKIVLWLVRGRRR